MSGAHYNFSPDGNAPACRVTDAESRSNPTNIRPPQPNDGKTGNNPNKSPPPQISPPFDAPTPEDPPPETLRSFLPNHPNKSGIVREATGVPARSMAEFKPRPEKQSSSSLVAAVSADRAEKRQDSSPEKDRFWELQVSRKIPETIPPEKRNVWKLYEKLVAIHPENYRGEVPTYETVLHEGPTQRNILSAEKHTGNTLEYNRTRWALQSSLLLYELDFGGSGSKAEQSTNFLYHWHEPAFQFGGNSPTIGKAAWEIMRTVPVADITEAIGYPEFTADTIEYLNPPSGRHPDKFPAPPTWLKYVKPTLYRDLMKLRDLVTPRRTRKAIDWFSKITDKSYQ